MLTQSQMIAEVHSLLDPDLGISKAGVKLVFDGLEEIVLDEIAAGEKVKVCQLVQLQPKVKAATKARMGRNPATGEAVKIKAKPASVVVRARVLARAKEAAPSVKKLQG
jgi:nucleoid DNA-binding protein